MTARTALPFAAFASCESGLLRTLGAQPGNDFVVSFAESSIQGCQMVVSNPVEVCALCEKVAGRRQLSPVAGIPKRVGYIWL